MWQVYVELNRHVNFFLIEGMPIKITSNMKDTYPKFKTLSVCSILKNHAYQKMHFMNFVIPRLVWNFVTLN